MVVMCFLATVYNLHREPIETTRARMLQGFDPPTRQVGIRWRDLRQLLRELPLGMFAPKDKAGRMPKQPSVHESAEQ